MGKDGDRKYSPIRETDDENKMQSVDNSSEQYSQYDDSAEISKKTKFNVKKQDSIISSNDGLSISASNPVMSKFSKQVAALMNENKKKKDAQQSYEMDEEEEDDSDNSKSNDDDDDDDDSEESAPKKKPAGGAQIGTISAMYQKYRKVQEKLAKAMQDGVEQDDDSGSITISKST